MPNPISVTEGLVIRGNVFVNWHSDFKYFMSLGLGACTGTGLPCEQSTVRPALLLTCSRICCAQQQQQQEQQQASHASGAPRHCAGTTTGCSSSCYLHIKCTIEWQVSAAQGDPVQRHLALWHWYQFWFFCRLTLLPQLLPADIGLGPCAPFHHCACN